MIHAARSGQTAAAKTLILRDVDVNVKDENGIPVLNMAIVRKNLSLVKALIEKRADVNAKDKDGNTPLILASNLGSSDILKTLLEAGAKIQDKDDQGNTALMHAGNTEVAQLLSKDEASLKEKNNDGLTPFLCAASANRAEVVRYWLDRNISVDEKDRNDATALFWAAVSHRGGSMETLQALLDRRANINAKNKAGQNVLVSAIKWGEGKNK